MKKYIAVQNPNDDYNAEWYFDEDTAKNQDIWIGGNRDYIEFNLPLVDFEDRLDRMLSDVEYDMEENDLDHPTREIVYNNAKQFFKLADGSEISQSDAVRLYTFACRYYEVDRENEQQDIICRILEVLHKKYFKHGMLRGSSQGEWMNYVCPESVPQKYLDWIEAVIFGTGSEFIVTENMVDESMTPEDVLGLGKSSTDTSTYFSASYTGQTIRNELADDIGCKPDEIDVYIVDTYHQGKFEKI